MSTFKELNISNPGTSTKFGGNDTDLFSKLLNGTVAGIPPVLIKSQNKFGFGDAILWFYNQAASKKTTIRGQSNVPATDVDLKLPPITANDTLAAIGISNIFSVPQEFDLGTYLKEMDTPGSNPPSLLHQLFVGLDGHLRKISPTGIVTDYNVSASIPSFFPSGILRVQNPAQSFYYNILGEAITGADKNLTLPLITANDYLLSRTSTDTVKNKTFDDTNLFNMGSGDLNIFNPTGTFKYTVIASAITANRNVTEPLLIANDTRVYESHIQTLIGKQMDAGLNTLLQVKKYALLEGYGEYLCMSDYYADGYGMFQEIQGYGTLGVFGSANGRQQTWTTSTTVDDVAGVVATNGQYGITGMNCNPVVRTRLSLSKLSGPNDSRFYYGFYAPMASHIARSDTPLSNTTAGILIGWRSTDTNFFIFRSDGTAAGTPIDTGLAIATSAAFYILELEVTGGNNVNWKILNDALTVLASGSVTVNIPISAARLNFHAVLQNSTTTAKGVTFQACRIKASK